MRILAALLLCASSVFPQNTLNVFGRDWSVQAIADWKVIEEDGNQVLQLVQHRGPLPGPRRPIQFALALTQDFSQVNVEADVRPLGKSLIIVFAYRDPAHFDYAHLSADTGIKEPVHNGVFHVFGGERVRISNQSGPAAFQETGRWYHVVLTHDGNSGVVRVSVDGHSIPALYAVDLSLTAGKVGIGSFDETGDFKNVKLKGAHLGSCQPVNPGCNSPRELLPHTPLNPIIRVMEQTDIPAALFLSSAAGWNQTPDDWRMLLQLAASTCFGIEADGRIVATTTLIRHGPSLGWIGMVLTHADYRRRGFARMLLERTLEEAESLGIRTLKLDATEQGQPLYERLGFTAEQEIQRWTGQAVTVSFDESNKDHDDTNSIMALDAGAFESDRAPLLRALMARQRPFVSSGAFLFLRPGLRASYLGPCIGESHVSAAQLISRCLGAGDALWFWDLFPANEHVVQLASDLGFKVERRLMRMVRGPAVTSRTSLVYAAAGFEFG